MHAPGTWIGRSRSLAVAAIAVVLAAASQAAGGVSEQIVVSGAVKSRLSLTVDDLKAFGAEQTGTVTVRRRVADKEVDSQLRGVRLTAVLEKAGLASSDQNEWKHTIVLATATDGYSVVFSWPELFNSSAGSDMLVVFERDGKPLADREGRIALVSGRDLRTGPRSVRWLARLDVRVIQD